MDEIFPGELGYQQEHLRNREHSHEMTEVSMEDISESLPVIREIRSFLWFSRDMAGQADKRIGGKNYK